MFCKMYFRLVSKIYHEAAEIKGIDPELASTWKEYALR